MASPACIISNRKGIDVTDKTIHSIPCKVHYDGPAPVSRYFIAKEKPSGRKTAAFRGHGLDGVDLCMPPGYELCVLKRRDNGTFDIDSRHKLFVLWEWDREAGKRSIASRALSQLKIAQALADD